MNTTTAIPDSTRQIFQMHGPNNVDSAFQSDIDPGEIGYQRSVSFALEERFEELTSILEAIDIVRPELWKFTDDAREILKASYVLLQDTDSTF